MRLMKKKASSAKRSKPATTKTRFVVRSSFPIVGIGASAGGLEEVTLLLKHLPPDTGTLQDIDAVKRTLAEVEAARSYAEAITATVREPLLFLSADLRVKTANQSFYSFFRTTPTSIQDKFIYDLNDLASDVPRLRELLNKILPDKSIIRDFLIEHDFPGIGRKTMLLNARRLAPEAVQPALIMLALEYVTAKPEQL